MTPALSTAAQRFPPFFE